MKTTVMTAKQRRFYLRYRSQSKKVITSFHVVIGKYFKGQRYRIEKALNEYESKVLRERVNAEKVADELFSPKEESDVLKTAIRGYYGRAIDVATRLIDKDKGENILTDTQKRRVISRRASLVVRINRTTRKKIIKAVSKAYTDGVGLPQVIDELRKNVDTSVLHAYRHRTQTIARTETRYIYQDVAEIQYKNLGVKFVDVVGCVDLEDYSDCGRRDVPLREVSSLVFHPNHIGHIMPQVA